MLHEITTKLLVAERSAHIGTKKTKAVYLLFSSCLNIKGRGIETEIIQTLEQDEYFLRATRIELPASITGTPFYRNMGYDYKNGIDKPDYEGLLRLEKLRLTKDLNC